MSAGEPRSTKRYLDEALSAAPEDPELWYLRGRARQKLLEKDAATLQDHLKARELGMEAIEIDDYIGRLCIRLGERNELAGESLLRFIVRETKPNDLACGHYRLAQLRERQGRRVEAREDARTSRTLAAC